MNKFKKFKTPEEMRVKDFKQLLNYCYWLLERRDYSKADLSIKMKRYAKDPQDIPKVISRLDELKYIDDDRVAQSTLRSEVYKGSGPKKIEMKLRQKGLSSEQVKNEIENVDWLKKAVELKLKKFGSDVETDYTLKAKQVRFLMSRGFDYSIASKAIGYDADYEFD